MWWILVKNTIFTDLQFAIRYFTRACNSIKLIKFPKRVIIYVLTFDCVNMGNGMNECLGAKGYSFFLQNSTPFLGLGKAGGEWWETGGREKGDGKFENEDKCFKVCVFVEKGETAGNHYVIIVPTPCIVYAMHGFCCFPFVTSGAFCMLEIIPCLYIDGLKHRVGTSVIYESWS